MRRLLAFVTGLVFGLGLLISDMANPARVLAFLDVLAIPQGGWDPTLMFVMAGAMAVSGLAWLIVTRRRAGGRPALFGGALPGPAGRVIAPRLIGGAALFGIGWGLAGICPGPGVVGLGLVGIGQAGAPILLFVACMVAGMLGFGLVERLLSRRRTPRDPARAR